MDQRRIALNCESFHSHIIISLTPFNDRSRHIGIRHGLSLSRRMDITRSVVAKKEYEIDLNYPQKRERERERKSETSIHRSIDQINSFASISSLLLACLLDGDDYFLLACLRKTDKLN